MGGIVLVELVPRSQSSVKLAEALIWASAALLIYAMGFALCILLPASMVGIVIVLVTVGFLAAWPRIGIHNHPPLLPRNFTLLTLTLIFPLSFASLAHSLFTHPLLLHLQHSHSSSSTRRDVLLLLFYQLLYLLLLFSFSLLSTASVVFSVASLYTSKPLSFSTSLSALPSILPRLFRTFLWVSLLMVLYNLIFAFSIVLVVVAIDANNSFLFAVSLFVSLSLFLIVHVYITALWHLASVISVLEPVCGLAAMRKSRELLRGRTRMAAALVFFYLSACGFVGGVFGAVVVRGGEDYGSYHHQPIDKSALYDHLGGYLGEYVPLKSSIQMENLDM
ncbi:hypothetical protein QJS10_CPA01g00671 [Acorus calamus]|uniref:Uncharacterized protein n=1 Tax=Acorus calamus TaxID=4465 RepID=A0AAV9FJR4_ACOCL|nr:hypothetical protein QJS10_CPA01g00671 [Acorus calamus]